MGERQKCVTNAAGNTKRSCGKKDAAKEAARRATAACMAMPPAEIASRCELPHPELAQNISRQLCAKSKSKMEAAAALLRKKPVYKREQDVCKH